MNNKIAFTICSNNYLAQAQTLVDSFLNYNPNYSFIIGLCDKKNELIDYTIFDNCTIVDVEDLKIPDFDNMCKIYDIVELNTSIKPFYFNYIFENYNSELVLYIDPDICFYSSVKIIESEMSNYDIFLTPHIYSPMLIDGLIPHENTFLNFGLYNLGFLGLRNSPITFSLLNWWSEKLKKDCRSILSEGYFVDQLPMNYVPLFFEKVLVSRNLGLNVAYWNMHERVISKGATGYKINKKDDLVFFHFSSYKPEMKNQITPHFTRFFMANYPIIEELFFLYYEELNKNKYFDNVNVPCFYVQQRAIYLEQERIEVLNNETISKKIRRAIKALMPSFINEIILKYARL